MLTAEGFASFPGQAWGKVLAKARKAVVFVDDRCAESLHWCGGAAALLDAGARNVKRLSSFEAAGEDEPKAVFVVSGLLRGRTADTVKDVVSLSRLQYCVVFTAVPHSVHLQAAGLPAEGAEEDSLFARFGEQLCEWMGDMNYTAEVLHAPVLFAPVSPQLVLLPAFSDLFPLLPADLEAVNRKRPEKKRFGGLADVDAHSLPPELQIQIRCLASALGAMFESSNTKEDCFAVGPMSRLIAAELANQPQARNRRKTAANKASVVFIDRTLDVTGAVGHHGDNLVEKILSVLPPLPGHTNDVQVDMLDLTNMQRSPDTEGVLAPGCLAQNQSAAAQSLWETMLVAKQKEAVMEVRRQLVEAASKENLPIKMSLGRVTTEQLFSYAQLFKGKAEAVENHAGVLQLTLATAQTLSHPSLSRWDASLGFERLLLQAVGDSDLAAVLRQVLPLIKSASSSEGSAGSGEAGLQVDELLAMLVFLYSLSGEALPGDGDQEERVERELIGALTLLLTQQTNLSPLLQSITGVLSPAELVMERAHSVLESVFTTLRGLGHARSHMKQLRSVYSPSDGVHQATYRPFIKQILEEIFHPDRPECPDIEHASSGLTDLLKTGFSMFMKVNRPHPSDHSVLILFLVGGVTPSEIRLVRDTVAAQKPGAQVLVFSTRLLRPADIPHLLFSTNRLVPDIGV